MDFNIHWGIKATIIGFTGFAQVGKDTAAGFLVEHGFTRLAFADILRQSLYNLDPIVHVGAAVIYDYDFGGNVCWGMGAKPPVKGAEAFSTRVRHIVDQIGWDRAKNEYPEIRALLQRFGTEVGRELYGENFWVERVMNQIQDGGKYVVTDVRFPNEEVAVHERGGRVFRIHRPGVGPINTHVSDTGIANLHVDAVIPNTADLEHFRSLVLSVAGVK